jgi:uncharacterized protein HemY
MSAPDFESLKKRVEQFPDNELFRFSLGKAFFDTGSYQEAIEHFDIALKKKPDWMVVAILIGKSWLQLQDRQKARQYIQLGQKLAREQDHEGPLEETTALLSQI